MLPARGLITAVASQETKEHERAPLPSSSSLAAAIPLRVNAEGSRDTFIQPFIITASNSSPTDRTNVSSTIDLPLVPATSLFRLMNSSDHLGAPGSLPGVSRASLDRVDDNAMTDDPSTTGQAATSAPQHTAPSTLPQAQHGARGDRIMMQEHKSAVREDPPAAASAGPVRVPSIFENFASTLKATFNKASANPVAPVPNMTCNCLVIDKSKMEELDPNRLQLSMAIGLRFNEPGLRKHVLSWLQINDPNDLSVTYIVNQRVHFNFSSIEALGRTLEKFVFLTRCGTLPSVWTKYDACGPSRDKFPEGIRITVLPSREVAPQELMPTILAALKDAKLEYSAVWFSPSSVPNPARAGANQKPRIGFWVMPRCIRTLAADIDRLHHTLDLFGAKAAVDAPNNPDLHRCRQCDKLGHRDSDCPEYSGLALRFLFKEKAPYAVLHRLVGETGARLGYLGSDVNNYSPDHRVTLLFRASDQEDLERLASQLEPVLLAYSSLLHGPPELVKSKDRKSECTSCGSLTRDHACPFAVMRRQPLVRNLGLASRSAQGGRAQPAAVARSESNMCRAWRLNKSCPRQEKGQRCSYEHPASHVAQPKFCFEFARSGHCSRGTTCVFPHAADPQAPSSSSVPAAAAASSSAPSVPEPRVDINAPSSAAATSASAPAQSPARKRKPTAATDDSGSGAAAAASSTSTALSITKSNKKSKVDSSVAVSASPGNKAGSRPASGATSVAGIAADPSRWSFMTDDADEEELERMAQRQKDNARQVSPPPTRPPTSSLSFLSMGSPAKAAAASKSRASASASSSLSRTASKGGGQ